VPALPVGRPRQTAPASGRTCARQHRHRPASTPGRRRRREAACRRCAGRSGRRVRSAHHRRHRGRGRHAFWSRAFRLRRGPDPGPTRRGFRASLRDRNHHDLAMNPGSMPMSTGGQARQPREELFACESPLGVVRGNSARPSPQISQCCGTEATVVNRWPGSWFRRDATKPRAQENPSTPLPLRLSS
jgi:cytochrome c553